MDSSQGLLSERCHKTDIASLVPEPTASWPAGSTRDPDDEMSSQLVDVTAEETCPTNAPQMPSEDEALTPVSPTAKAPSKTAFVLMSELEALAGDLAAKERNAASDPHIENVREGSDFSAGPQVSEPSIQVTPRATGFDGDLFAIDRPSIGRRTTATLVSFLLVALIGVAGTFAWQSHRVSSATPSHEADIAAEQPRATPAAPVPASGAALPQSGSAPQTALAPGATAQSSPELLKQLEAMAQDLASVRRGVEQLAAKQEQLAAAQQRLEQLAAKREQTAQNAAKPQPREHAIRQKMPPAPQSRAALIPPRPSPDPPAQLSSAPPPRSESHPLPPLPVPP
ncbi:MAG TPA: hypothetical protein VEC94_15180 [Pseudolabrys sp.]|nr:hypothetical protein [Pseudolabrys sp.]